MATSSQVKDDALDYSTSTGSSVSDEARQLDQKMDLLMSFEPEGANEHLFIGQQYAMISDEFLDQWRSTSNETYHKEARTALSKSIELCRMGAEMLTSSGEDGNEIEFWAFAAQMAQSMYETFSDLAALSEAISYYRKALQDSDCDPQTHAAVLLNLANCLMDKAETEDCTDRATRHIDEAIERGQSAMATLGSDPICLSDISTMFLTRFEKQGQLQDLEQATYLSNEALDKTNPEDTAISSRGSNYAQCLQYHYRRTGSQIYLDQAIDLLLEARTRCSSAPDLPRAKILGNLALTLNLRYQSLGTIPDLLGEIENASAAWEIGNQKGESFTCSTILSNLASYYHSYYHAVPERDSINSAIKFAELAVEALKDNPPRRSMCLYNLAIMLDDKSKSDTRLSEREQDALLAQAITYLEQSTQAQNLDQSLVAMQNDFWSRLLLERYKRLGCQDEDILMTAISKAKAATQLSVELQDTRADFLVQLADVHKLRYDKYGDEESFKVALEALEECSKLKSARILTRINACHRAALLYTDTRQFEKAAGFAEMAVNMMPDLTYCALERKSQQKVLEDVSGLSNLASALALEAGSTPGKAFELLEAGRSIMSSRLTDFLQGLDWSRLGYEGRELLDTYRRLRQRTETPLTAEFLEAEYPTALTNQISHRLKDIDDATKIAEQLKTEHGFDVSPRLDKKEIAEMASGSPIVAFLFADFRSSALIATGSGIQTLELPDLKFDECAEHYQTMQMPVEGALRSLKFENVFEVNENMTRLLVWLWDVAVLPVLKFLGYYTSKKPGPTSQLPRIHWVTSNVMGLMPLHAAGHHDDSSVENALSHVVSSYTTTVLSLRHSIRTIENWPLVDPASQSKMVIIGMTESPGSWSNFDRVPEHLQAVEQFVADDKNRTYLQNPTNSDALDALSVSQMAHIVCHGISQGDPSNSSLVLCREEPSESGGKPELVEDPLSVRQIASRASKSSYLAFLAACQTADKMATGLMDENIHIVGAFQSLGYANVIGTLWEVEEKASVSFATEFYASLAHRAQVCHHENGHNTRDVVARASHDAMLFLRDQDPEYMVTWAPMVHFGA
ncbi:TPR Domain containing protein [Fusarium austroafricanum]|uniref:TPR Domain containing protein n=1 Tax=Fusarium austroafricanum TaxID=2364996 RepID=A0A8H4NYF0_9HYPO|nr:TPR Domain containing protein [Fusarium austroafricanum]